MLEYIKKVTFAALCMCVCVSMKVRAEEYFVDDAMAVAESITVKLENGKTVPGGFEKNPCYTENSKIIETKPEPEPEPEPGPGPGGEGETGTEGEGTGDNVPWYKRIIEVITSIPEKITEGVKALFVPSKEALEEHERIFNEKFNFWSGIKEQFEKVVAMLQSDGTPPKIKMDLSSMGAGKVKVLDFSGIDLTLFKKLESAFLWLSYILLLFKNATNIIRGETTEAEK